MVKWLLVSLIVFSFDAMAQKRLYVFFDTECPICQSYTKRVENLYSQYKKNVKFTLVYPTRGTTKTAVRTFAKEYSLNLPFKIDKNLSITRTLKATVMPEVVLFDGKKIVYRGAIDDQFVALGRARPKVTEPYLENVLQRLVATPELSYSETKAIGCTINKK